VLLYDLLRQLLLLGGVKGYLILIVFDLDNRDLHLVIAIVGVCVRVLNL
jgi:hypothetical protein